jgi:PAS domain S-box-containing protein
MQSFIEFILQNMQEAVVVWTRPGKITGWNRSAERIYGYSRNEALQLPFVILIPEENRSAFVAPVEKEDAGEHAEHFEATRLTKEGKDVFLMITRIQIARGQDQTECFVELALPISERKQALLSVAHNLRNALSSMSTLSYLLEHNFDQKHLERLNRQLVLCDSIVDNLLERGGVRRKKRETVNLSQLSRDVVAMFDFPVGTKLEIVSATEVCASADSGQVQQVLINLLQNSIEALEGKPGEIVIHIRDESPFVRVEVSDNGPGIALADPSRAFEPMVTTKLNGMGLGLTACKQMVEENFGKIRVESQRGVGTKFSVMLPKAES